MAAFYVVVSHGSPWLEKHVPVALPVRIFLGNGALAVCLFFLLSGFILSYTYRGQFSGLGNYAKFWEARFARIYPVYFLSLLLALPFQFAHLNWKSGVAVVLMVQAWNPLHPEITGAWNYPAWSLSVEAFFYLCFPFLQSRIASLSRPALYWLGAVALGLAIFAHTPGQGLGNWDPSTMAGLRVPLPIVRFPEFLLGMVIGNYYVRFGSAVSRPAVTVLSVLASIAALSFTSGPWVSVVVLPFALLIYCLASSKDAITSCFANPLMLLLGGASYAIYLLQLPVRDWTRVTLARGPASINALNAPLTPIFLVLFSILVFRYWEEPLRRWIRRTLAARS